MARTHKLEMYRNIMFDLDGTVIDSGRAVYGEAA